MDKIQRCSVSNFMDFEPVYQTVLTSEAVDFCIEHYSLGGATPQINRNDLEITRRDTPSPPRDTNLIQYFVSAMWGYSQAKTINQSINLFI